MGKKLVLKTTLTIVATLLLMLVGAYGEVQYEKPYLAPDGKFSASIVNIDNGTTFQIKSTKDNKIVASYENMFPSLNLEWSRKSDAIYLVNHMAGGTFLQILFRRNGKWVFNADNNSYSDCEGDVDKGEDGKSFLYKYIISKNTVKAYFVFYVRKKTTTPSGDDFTQRIGVATQTISLSTGEVIDTSSKAISSSHYRKRLDSAPWEK